MQLGQEIRSLGKYHLIASLGQGGMAKVYLALMGGLAGFSKLLVVKVLRRDLLGGADDGVRMFIEEARLAARLVHPNIVHTYEVGEIHGHYFMAMEYLDGQPYSEILTRARGDKELPLAEHLRIVAEVARGLHYAHSLTGYQGEAQGIVHRDVSPQNIFVTYQGQVKLLDFGIAKPQDPSHLTQVGVIKGRLDYIAPEQLQCEPLDGRADVFALGAILWEALSGQRFAGGKKVSEIGKVQARIAAGERKLSEVVPELPVELVAIVERAIALLPQDRFPDAAALADALDAYVESMGERPSAKTLGRLLGGMFTGERESIGKLIDEQIQWTKRYTVEIGDTTGDLPRLALPNSNVTGSYPATATTTFTGLPMPGAPLEYNGAAMSAELGLDSKKKRLRMWLGAGVMALAVLIGGTLAWRERPSQVGSAVASGALPEADVISAAQRAKGAPENPASISIRLTTQPPDAHISLDGVVLLPPFSGEFRKDRALHHLEVTADGFKPVRSFLSFEEDQNLTIRLEPLASATREPGAEVASERSAAATSIATSERVRSSRSSATASVPSRAIVPGAEIEESDSRLDSDELDLDNPYLKRK